MASIELVSFMGSMAAKKGLHWSTLLIQEAKRSLLLKILREKLVSVEIKRFQFSQAETGHCGSWFRNNIRALIWYRISSRAVSHNNTLLIHNNTLLKTRIFHSLLVFQAKAGKDNLAKIMFPSLL